MGAIVFFVVATGAFFWAVFYFGSVIRKALERRRLDKLEAMLDKQKKK
jgi:hypothetical protein